MLYKLVRAELGLLLKQIYFSVTCFIVVITAFFPPSHEFLQRIPLQLKSTEGTIRNFLCLFLHTGNIPNTLNSKNFNSSR